MIGARAITKGEEVEEAAKEVDAAVDAAGEVMAAAAAAMEEEYDCPSELPRRAAHALCPTPPLLLSLRERLKRAHYAIIPAEEMLQLLRFYEPSTTPTPSVEEYSRYWDGAVPQTDEYGHPVYPFKGTLVSYYHVNASTAEDGTKGPYLEGMPSRVKAYKYVNAARQKQKEEGKEERNVGTSIRRQARYR